MQLSDFYPPTPDKVTYANTVISNLVKESDVQSLKFLQDIFTSAQKSCIEQNKPSAIESYGQLLVRTSGLIKELDQKVNFIEQH